MTDPKPGDRVTITGRHPWTGHSGKIADRLSVRLWRVRLDNGMTAGACEDQMRLDNEAIRTEISEAARNRNQDD